MSVCEIDPGYVTNLPMTVRPIGTDDESVPLRLDIGSGDHPLEGFHPIDRKLGTEAFPLPYSDDSVDEIHASHILEHFSYADVEIALREWVRVLRPGGLIRIAVPNISKVFADTSLVNDAKWRFYAMGGQTTEDDFHRSCFTEALLRHYMERSGIVGIEPWESTNGNCASLPFSLNLMGRKGTAAEVAAERAAAKEEIKIAAITSIPRVGWNDAWGVMFDSLMKLRIPLRRHTGVYWGQCMQRSFEAAIADGIDWLLAIDYDTMFTAEQLDRLIGWFARRPDIDALAALQCRRGPSGRPLCTTGDGEREKLIDGNPFKVATAHFGLTLIRTDALKEIPKPWFWSKPDAKGEWGDDRLDDDIWFWHQWKQAGKTVYIAPDVTVGHLEVMVTDYESKIEPARIEPSVWLERHKGQKHWRT